MITKQQIIIFLIAVLVLVGFVIVGFHTTNTPNNTDTTPTPTPVSTLWPSHEIAQGSIDQQNAYNTITAVYPKTSSDSITAYFKSFVDEQISQFTDDTSWAADMKNAEAQSLTLDITYTTTQASTVETYVFSVNSYTGGAHGMQFRKTFAFNKQGQLLTISNLFKNGFDGLPIFAKLVQAELLKRPTAQVSWVTDGAGPKEENYALFVVSDTGVKVLFDQYQVAPYSDGAIDITIPATAFKSIANPDIFPTIH